MPWSFEKDTLYSWFPNVLRGIINPSLDKYEYYSDIDNIIHFLFDDTYINDRTSLWCKDQNFSDTQCENLRKLLKALNDALNDLGNDANTADFHNSRHWPCIVAPAQAMLDEQAKSESV